MPLDLPPHLHERVVCSIAAAARGEVEQYRHFDYLILNDEVERASAQMAAVVLAERARRERQGWVARRVLASFADPGGFE